MRQGDGQRDHLPGLEKITLMYAAFMTDQKNTFLLGRRQALQSLIVAGAASGGVPLAGAAEKSTPAMDNPHKNQPNVGHIEPADQPGGNSKPVIRTQSDYFYRPSIHFSPLSGFMNDPNGLIFDGEYYHLYYQYNPTSPYAGRVHWGHAISRDLYTWQDLPIAIDQTPAGEAYTGCVVLDRDNMSGLFPPSAPDEKPAAVAPEDKSATQAAVDALTPSLGQHATDVPRAPDSIPSSGSQAGTSFGPFYAPAPPDVPTANAVSHLPPMAGGFVAIYTRATPQRQTQYVAWSPDGGRHFIDYAHNPVLDIGLNSFRDPKVFWHTPSGKWIMVVARAREHKIAFYGSIDLRHWMHLSSFGPSGLFGVDYECPNLIELDIEGPERGKRWVLFVSVNPGGPQGGSVTQYFVGDFDGERFIPDNTVIGLTDFAKDSYAMQVYDNMPRDETAYFAWLGNWQYCEEVPNRSWRGVMTLPRTLSLRRDDMNWLRLVQRPRGLAALRGEAIPFKVDRIAAQSGVQTVIPNGTALELSLTVTVDERKDPQPDGDHGRAGRFMIVFSNSQGETLSIGFDAFSSQIWLDRGNLRGFSQPFFTERFSTPLIAGSRRFSLQLVLDACALEIFVNDGLSVGTALVFPANPLDMLSLQATNVGASIENLALYPLRKTMDRMTSP
ncbi:levanase precursor [Gluconobacter morbifer G707]|uniref:Levanase n=2 Tax=Gluconobacter TaxID=441 RepID=G6XJL2_9PROT|nr:levanase precursor [Gluconobacter morbifer G707]